MRSMILCGEARSEAVEGCIPFVDLMNLLLSDSLLLDRFLMSMLCRVSEDGSSSQMSTACYRDCRVVVPIVEPWARWILLRDGSYGS